MATTNRIADTVLTVGQSVSAGGTLTPAQETIALQLTSVQIADSVARMIIRDTASGKTIGSTVIAGSGVTRILIDHIVAQAINGYIECLKGSCQVRLDEVTGIEACSGQNALDTDDIGDGSLATAKFAGGSVTPAKLGTFTAIKCLAAAGRVGAGVIALVGTAVGDRLIACFGIPTAGGALLPVVNNASVFEATITVVNQVQQVSVANLSANTYVFLLAPAAS